MNDEATTIGIIGRLGKLEGLIVGLQSSVTQSQDQWNLSQAKVARLEERLVQLEARQVTREDLKSLTDKVDKLITNEAAQSGGITVANWSIKNIATWAAILISGLALLSSWINRESIKIEEQQIEQIK